MLPILCKIVNKHYILLFILELERKSQNLVTVGGGVVVEVDMEAEAVEGGTKKVIQMLVTMEEVGVAVVAVAVAGGSLNQTEGVLEVEALENGVKMVVVQIMATLEDGVEEVVAAGGDRVQTEADMAAEAVEGGIKMVVQMMINLQAGAQVQVIMEGGAVVVVQDLGTKEVMKRASSRVGSRAMMAVRDQVGRNQVGMSKIIGNLLVLLVQIIILAGTNLQARKSKKVVGRTAGANQQQRILKAEVGKSQHLTGKQEVRIKQ